MKITPELLQSIAPVRGAKAEAQHRITQSLAPFLDAAMAEGEINTPLRQAHFLAQVATETDSFCALREYASGKAYEGRADLGNVNPGDGMRFAGRGPFMLTGRENYRNTGHALDLPLEHEPDLALKPDVGCEIAVLYWRSRGLNVLADKNDLRAITRKINGGTNGLAHRRDCFVRAAKLLDVDIPKPTSDLLSIGAVSEDVRLLQSRLNALRYFVGNEDGQFGPRTEDGLRAFQRQAGLMIDGKALVGGPTWVELAKALQEGETRVVAPERASEGLRDIAGKGSRIATSAVRGLIATGAAITSSAGLVLSDAADTYSSWLIPFKKIAEPFGGASQTSLIILAAAAGYSALQHHRAGKARVGDHNAGRTL